MPLQRPFGADLPATVTFDHPTVQALTGYLASVPSRGHNLSLLTARPLLLQLLASHRCSTLLPPTILTFDVNRPHCLNQQHAT